MHPELVPSLVSLETLTSTLQISKLSVMNRIAGGFILKDKIVPYPFGRLDADITPQGIVLRTSLDEYMKREQAYKESLLHQSHQDKAV